MNVSIDPTEFRIVPLALDLADRIRQTLADEFGNRLAVWEADSVPCRLCLQRTKPGEPVILFAHRPFDFTGPYAEVGPILFTRAHASATRTPAFSRLTLQTECSP